MQFVNSLNNALTSGLSLFMLCKPLSILPTAWAVSGSVHVFTNRGNSLNKAFTSGSQSSFLASHRASCLPLVFWKVHYMSWLIEVTLSRNLSLQDNPSFNLSSHRASWLRLALSGSYHVFTNRGNSVNNALTSRFQSTYDDDNIDDDDVSIWPPIHLLILKALRIIALHYVDTH